MDNKEFILRCLENYISEEYDVLNLYSLNRVANRKYGVQSCYKRWAADEFLTYLRLSGSNPYNSARRFIAMLNQFCERGTKLTKDIFSIASGVSMELLDYMQALQS